MKTGWRRRGWGIAIGLTIAVVAFCFFEIDDEQTFVLSNGSVVKIYCVNYGRDNHYYSTRFRRAIAKNSRFEESWKSLVRTVPPLLRFEREGTYDRGTPVVVVWGSVQNEVKRVLQWRAVDFAGVETVPLDYDPFFKEMGFTNVEVGFIAAFQLSNAPIALRIFEVDDETGTITRLGEIPVLRSAK